MTEIMIMSFRPATGQSLATRVTRKDFLEGMALQLGRQGWTEFRYGLRAHQVGELAGTKLGKHQVTLKGTEW